MTYLDFDLEILDASDGDYPLAVRCEAGDARALLRLPFDLNHRISLDREEPRVIHTMSHQRCDL